MKNKLIILLLLTAFGQAWAQDPVALPKWNSHVSAMVGLGMPSISDIRKPFQVTEQYRAILLHAGAGADCQFGSNWGGCWRPLCPVLRLWKDPLIMGQDRKAGKSYAIRSGGNEMEYPVCRCRSLCILQFL